MTKWVQQWLNRGKRWLPWYTDSHKHMAKPPQTTPCQLDTHMHLLKPYFCPQRMAIMKSNFCHTRYNHCACWGSSDRANPSPTRRDKLSFLPLGNVHSRFFSQLTYTNKTHRPPSISLSLSPTVSLSLSPSLSLSLSPAHLFPHHQPLEN